MEKELDNYDKRLTVQILRPKNRTALIEIDERKSGMCTYKQHVHIPININSTNVPYNNSGKYFGININVQLCCKKHVKNENRVKLKIKKKILVTLKKNLSYSDISSYYSINK